MKPDYDMLFGNFFNDPRIIDSRLYTFSEDSLNHFISANTNSRYDATIASLTPLVGAFGNEQGDVAFALNKQKGNTDTTDALLAEFINTMRNREGEIGYKLGGKDTPAYILFYPQGVSQYTRATKAVMPVLTRQVKEAATSHAAQLGTELTTLLTAFGTRWTATRGSQEQQMGSVDSNRGERTLARRNLERGMLNAIHAVALSDIGNVALGESLFDFSLLYGQTKRGHSNYAATLGADEMNAVANRLFTNSAVIRVSNTGTNAAFVIYLGATANAAPPADAETLNPGESHGFVPSKLGSLQNPYLLVKNTSMVNSCSYEVEIAG